MALIKESAVLMQHLQALKEEHIAVAGRVDPNLCAPRSPAPEASRGEGRGCWVGLEKKNQ